MGNLLSSSNSTPESKNDTTLKTPNPPMPGQTLFLYNDNIPQKTFRSGLNLPPLKVPITSGIVGYYDVSTFINNTWYDISGSNNNATQLGGTFIINNNYLSGTTSSSIIFPTAILPQTYTLITLAKYTGSGNGRIFQGATQNWLSGFWGGKSGVAFHNGWLTQYSTSEFGNNWLLSVDQNNSYRGNVNNLTNPNSKISQQTYDNLAINTGAHPAETSNWDIAMIAVYNRSLSADEITLLENWIMSQYPELLNGLTEAVSIKPITTPVSTGLIGYYDSTGYINGVWQDLSGSNNHVFNINGTITKVGNYLTGTTATNIIFPDDILPATYTLFTVAKYTGGDNQRIFQGATQNWLSGFWNGNSGVAHHNGWITSTVNQFNNDWVLSTDQNDSYRANTNFLTTAPPPSGAATYDILSINAGASPNEISNWAIALIAVFNRTLTISEIVTMENWIMNKYPSLFSNWIETINIQTVKTPIMNGLIGYYDSNSFIGSIWEDLSGANNHVYRINGSIKKSNDDTYLTGDTSSNIIFPPKILPENYTLFTVAKYNGSTKGRIFQGMTQNWLSGFWSNKSGVNYHNGWLTQSSSSVFGDSWVLSTDQNNFYRANGKDLSINSISGTTTWDNISINTGAYPTETSNWAVALVMVYNRKLSSSEISTVENYIISTYSHILGDLVNSMQANMTRVYISGLYGIAPWASASNFIDSSAFWIWNTPNASLGAPINTSSNPVILTQVYYNNTSSPINAIIYAIVDDHATFYLNGIQVGSKFSAGWNSNYTSIPVSIPPGENLFQFNCINDSGSAGLIASVISKNTILFNTDYTWYCVANQTLNIPSPLIQLLLQNDINNTYNNTKYPITMNGQAQFTTIAGKKCIQFPNSMSNYISFPFPNTKQFTFCYWMYAIDNPYYTVASITNNGFNPSFQCDIGNPNGQPSPPSTIRIIISAPVQWTIATQYTFNYVGIWTHITYTYDQSTFAAQLFVNGALVLSGQGSGAFAYNPTTFILGRSGDNGRAFNGYMYNYNYFDSILSTVDIQQIYNIN